MQLHDHLTNEQTFSAGKAENPALIAKKLRSKGVEVPFPSPAPTENTKWTFKFEKPERINMIGSWSNDISVKYKDGINFGVDMSIEMPDVSETLSHLPLHVIYSLLISFLRWIFHGRRSFKKRTISTIVFFTKKPYIWPASQLQ
jgi:hypothetical protein